MRLQGRSDRLRLLHSELDRILTGVPFAYGGMPMLPVTSSVAGVADVVLVHVDLERAGPLHEGCVRGVHSH